MARQAQWAFFGAQVAANPPAFAANISWGRDGVGDVASAKIDLSAPLPLQFIFGWLGDSSDHNASDAVCHKEALDSGWIGYEGRRVGPPFPVCTLVATH